MSKENEWSLNGFLDELKRIHETMPDRRFVFILGAGASIESNVKGADSLASEWMKIIFRREKGREGKDYQSWLEGNPLQIKKWDASNLAAHYPQIFSKCFAGDHESGHAELEKAIEQGSPSFGYAVLAWILAQDRHNMVVTTNFDNLVADSMYIYGGKTPHVIGHESLARYLKPMSRRPMIAKIHRDLFTDPINDEDGVCELKSDWVGALRNIFRFYTPVFIGYGGNDGSLMNFLNSLETNDISGRPFWCYYEKAGEPNNDITELMAKHKGILVPAPGFDQLMFEIGTNWGYERQQQHKLVTEHTKQMLDTLDKKIEEVYKESPKEIQDKLRETNPSEEKSWLDWQFEAAEKESDEEKAEVYKKALRALPNSHQLFTNYAEVLNELGKYKEAETYCKKALEIEPNNPNYLGNYAIILENLDRDEKAEIYYKRALELKANHVNNLGNYALLLKKLCRDEEAETYYKKTLEVEPNHAHFLGSYAILLEKLDRDEEAKINLKKSVEIDPSDANNLGNYAELLHKLGNNEEAKQFYTRCLEMDPDHCYHKEKYEQFLKDTEIGD